MAFQLDKIHRDIRKLRQFLKHAPTDPSPKQVHSLRTRIRRFEAATQALKLSSNKNAKLVFRKLAKLHKHAGKVRDLDVLTGFVADLKVSGEDDCRIRLLEYLGAEHGRRSRRLHLFCLENGKTLRRRLKRMAGMLETPSKAGVTEPADTVLSESRLQREMTMPVRLTKQNLHPFRLRVKELRTMLQMETDPADQAMIATMGKVKDAIGEWHDWQQLLTIAREHLAHGKKCKLIQQFQKTTEKKLKHAMVVANAGREQLQSVAARNAKNR